MHLRSSSNIKSTQIDMNDHLSENTESSENPVVYKNSIFEPFQLK
jgi:hypothetical protein